MQRKQGVLETGHGFSVRFRIAKPNNPRRMIAGTSASGRDEAEIYRVFQHARIATGQGAHLGRQFRRCHQKHINHTRPFLQPRDSHGIKIRQQQHQHAMGFAGQQSALQRLIRLEIDARTIDQNAVSWFARAVKAFELVAARKRLDQAHHLHPFHRFVQLEG